nr:Hypothetical protein [Raoultella ornithinolytica]
MAQRSEGIAAAAGWRGFGNCDGNIAAPYFYGLARHYKQALEGQISN